MCTSFNEGGEWVHAARPRNARRRSAPDASGRLASFSVEGGGSRVNVMKIFEDRESLEVRVCLINITVPPLHPPRVHLTSIT